MATSGALADFKRLPPERKALLFGVVGLLVGLLYFQFGYRSLNEALETAEATQSAKVQTDNTLGTNLTKYDDAKTKYNALTAAIAKNQTALPTEAELPAFFDTLNHKVIDAGVRVLNYKRQPEEKVESFIKAPVKFEISGTFMQIKRFFASLVQKDVGPATPVPGDAPPAAEDRERIVSIENLSLGTPTIRDRQLYLTAKFTASTFRQEEKKPAPGAPGAGSGSGSGAGSGSAVMPMPSAATPAGAKARVENSLEKADNKDRNATGVDEAKTPAGSGSDRLKGGI